jgi:prophage regulatory protein
MTPKQSPRQAIAAHDRFVRNPERIAITAVPTSSWYLLQDQGLAPRPVKIGERSVAWLLSELLAWVEAQCAARDAGAKS